ncbi:DUF4855 domain-containing protein [Paenibacillus sp. LjRoot153]|uniref:DUF4855 domain-containing protein n=1 Tax=Paenibacillus sp. LjRoot153 TaxID=3342270 RepID=UPI003F50124E
MYLAYLYQKGRNPDEMSLWTKDDFYPIIAHKNTAGETDRWLFDTVQFMAGGSMEEYAKKENWEYLLDQTFNKQFNLGALDKAAVEAKTALESNGKIQDQHKIQVILPIPFVDPISQVAWGTMAGKSLELNPAVVGEKASLANRVKIVDWYIQNARIRFKQENYGQLELAGFYWMKEEVGYNSASEAEFIQKSAEIVHHGSTGHEKQKLYWIPFYQANGFTFWKELGFDAVMMQPNYYFNAQNKLADCILEVVYTFQSRQLVVHRLAYRLDSYLSFWSQ